MALNRLKYLLIPMLLLGFGQGQSSHRDLCRELLKDFQRAVSDSISLPADSMVIHFSEDSNEGLYLDGCLDHNLRSLIPETGYRVDVDSSAITLEIQREPKKSLRNSRYIRQLEISVVFSYLDQVYTWKGKISDGLSPAQLKSLSSESFPVDPIGNYTADEPALILITITTLSVFSLGAALYFIRT